MCPGKGDTHPFLGACFITFPKSGFFHYILVIFNDFRRNFGDFWPILVDIGPFLRPDLGGKLGYGYQLQIYINQAFLRPLEDIQSRFMLKICQAKAIFIQGNC
jgi:hypothetical protein